MRFLQGNGSNQNEMKYYNKLTPKYETEPNWTRYE